ncbi:MAG: DUF4129 domain-containing protein [Bacteroidota bacterium]|nr:DUF4129 domain-containing protein [Bacteroidota bacterium]
MTMRNVEMKVHAFGFALFWLTLMMICQSSFAQSDSNFYHSDSVVTTNNQYNDSESTYDGYDTTGYYFNWKEHPDDSYTTEKINVRISSDTAVQRLKNDDDFWYVKSIENFKNNAVRLQYDRKYRDSLTKEGLLPPDKQVFKEEESGKEWYFQPWFFRMVWVLIISIFLAAVVYFLLSNKISLFSKNAAKTNRGEATIEEDVFNLNYEKLLQKYTDEKNYRFAVRVLYLQLLKLLSERGLIAYQPQFTNAQYLQQLQPSPLYQNFYTVTKHYEYIWYGEFGVTDNTFQTVKSDFINLKNQALHS